MVANAKSLFYSVFWKVVHSGSFLLQCILSLFIPKVPIRNKILGLLQSLKGKSGCNSVNCMDQDSGT